MATGDQPDILERIKALLPSWFGGSSTLLDATLQAYAWSGAFIYSLYIYAKLQTRILTATDGWLDVIAADYFGASLVRAPAQTDASFRNRIITGLLRERGTHYGIVKVLQDITGRAPIVVEIARPIDTGAYHYLYGYGVRGAYGSLLAPFQAFVTAYRPLGGSGYIASDADIYAAIDSVAPAGTIIWTAIVN